MNPQIWTAAKRAIKSDPSRRDYWGKVLLEYLKRAPMDRQQAQMIMETLSREGFDAAMAQTKDEGPSAQLIMCPSCGRKAMEGTRSCPDCQTSLVKESLNKSINDLLIGVPVERVIQEAEKLDGYHELRTAAALLASPLGNLRYFYGNESTCEDCGWPHEQGEDKCSGCGSNLNKLADYTVSMSDSLSTSVDKLLMEADLQMGDHVPDKDSSPCYYCGNSGMPTSQVSVKDDRGGKHSWALCGDCATRAINTRISSNEALFIDQAQGGNLRDEQ